MCQSNDTLHVSKEKCMDALNASLKSGRMQCVHTETKKNHLIR